MPAMSLKAAKWLHFPWIARLRTISVGDLEAAGREGRKPADYFLPEGRGDDLSPWSCLMGGSHGCGMCFELFVI